MRRRDAPLVVEGRGDLRSHELVERAVFDALREVLREVVARRLRAPNVPRWRNDRDSHRARTVPQPRRSRVAVVEPRRDERNVRVHVTEPVAARRHLPDERVRDLAPELVLQVQVQPAPSDRDVLAVAHEISAMRDGERDEVDDRRLVRVALVSRALRAEVEFERVTEAPRHAAPAPSSARRAEPPRAAAEQRRLAAARAPAADLLAGAAAALDAPAQRPRQRLSPVRRIPGLGARARHRPESLGPGRPVVDQLALESDSQRFPVVRQKLRLRAR